MIDREKYKRERTTPCPSSTSDMPLFIDLDGTLIHCDILLESILGLLRRNPLYVFLLPLWLVKGKANFKRQLAQRVDVETASLPYNAPFLEFLKAEHARGRILILATAAHRRYADQVAQHLRIFADVLATEDTNNLSGEQKLQAILARTQGRDFEYAANGRKDMVVWRRAHRAIVVNASKRVLGAVARVTHVTHVFHVPQAGLGEYVHALRMHQWTKNLLLFVPLITAHQWNNAGAMLNLSVALMAFCLCASGVYVMNDLLDAPADRQHPRKRLRPLVTGTIPPMHGFVLALLLPCAALLTAAWLPRQFIWMLLIYLIVATSYSLYFRRQTLLDVLLLAGLHTLRVIAGAIAIDVPLSFWLLAFSVFLFFSIALVKRCAELGALGHDPNAAAAGRDYRVSDLPYLRGMGIASGYVAVLVLALFIHSTDVAARYAHPQWLWLSCPPLLFWVSHVWIKEGRGEIHDDPLVYALRDPASYAVLATMLAALVMAI